MCIPKISTSLCIKDFNKLMYCKTKHKEKKYFCRHFLQCFSEERILIEHIKGCLRINSKKRTKTVGKGRKVKFTNHKKLIHHILTKTIFLAVMPLKFFALMIDLENRLLYIDVKMLFVDLLMQCSVKKCITERS